MGKGLAQKENLAEDILSLKASPCQSEASLGIRILNNERLFRLGRCCKRAVLFFNRLLEITSPAAGDCRHSIALSVGPMLDQLLDYAWVGKRAGVAEIAEVVFGNFSENPPHDFA